MNRYRLTLREKAIRIALRKILGESGGMPNFRILEILGETLSPREIETLIFRYAQEDGRKTLKETAERLGVTTREKPRQLEARAIKKLGESSRLDDFIPLKELERLEKTEKERQALFGIFKKCSFAGYWHIFYIIRNKGITLSDLETLSEEKVIKKLNIGRKGTETEKCLREIWRIVHSQDIHPLIVTTVSTQILR